MGKTISGVEGIKSMSNTLYKWRGSEKSVQGQICMEKIVKATGISLLTPKENSVKGHCIESIVLEIDTST